MVDGLCNSDSVSEGMHDLTNGKLVLETNNLYEG